MIKKERIYENLVRLIQAPSISGTGDEVLAAEKIEELLYEIPYFQAHPEAVMRVPVPEDPFGRYLVAAWLETAPDRPDTVILTGHYDVVDLEEYGELKEIACDVEEITRRIGELPLPDQAREDYESGEWLFGRGTADMKLGHALSIELLRHYAEEGNPAGNLLYIAVYGEETNSEGMLAALPFFNRFAEEKKLRYRVMLLTECFLVDGAEDGTKYMQFGASGKVMPLFFCAGAATHGEEPLMGLDASLMASEVLRRMHLNPTFCQTNHGITTPLPVVMKLQDLKNSYSLSSALYAAAYFNISTIRLEPESLMKKLVSVAEDAFQDVAAQVEKRTQDFAALTGRQPVTCKITPCVKTFREIFDMAKARFDGDLTAYLKEYAAAQMKENPEIQDVCIKLVKRIYELCGEKRPMIIVAIIPPYYPDVNVDLADEDTARMLRCADELTRYAAETYGEKLGTSEYYGVSDLCYTWLAEGMDFDSLFDNLAGLDLAYRFPADEMKKFKVPGIVLGGYGKDMHKYTERLHRHYNFDVLPDLYLKYIEMILDDCTL